MLSRIEDLSHRNMLIFLACFFLVFYVIQIPLWTSNADVLVYSCRASVERPILKYAFLDEQYLLDENPLPNYHLLHTLILWFFYHILPQSISDTIWPSGLVSAISGMLIIILTFLIWLRLGFPKKTAFAVSIVVGFVPSIWYHSLIGEVYSLQLFFILFFLYFFLRNNLILSTLGFLFANLVSPVSALSFSFILLAEKNKKLIFRALGVGFFALFLYLITSLLVDPNFFSILQSMKSIDTGRSVPWRWYKLGKYILLNFHLLLYFFICGVSSLKRERKKLLIYLFLSVIPQFVLALGSSNFLKEAGSFQLPLFWALSFPIGFYISSEAKISRRYAFFSFVALISIFLAVWIIPNYQIAKQRHRAGLWLKLNIPEELKIMGDWNNSIGIVLDRYGWDFEKLSSKYIHKPFPETQDLIKSKQDALIIVKPKRSKLRVLLSRLPVPGLGIKKYDPRNEINKGQVQYLYENNGVALFRWDYRK